MPCSVPIMAALPAKPWMAIFARAVTGQKERLTDKQIMTYCIERYM